MTKTFKVERKGKQTWVAVRQMPHDPQYKVGSRIPGLGKVVEEQSSTAALCEQKLLEALKATFRLINDNADELAAIAAGGPDEVNAVCDMAMGAIREAA